MSWRVEKEVVFIHVMFTLNELEALNSSSAPIFVAYIYHVLQCSTDDMLP